MWCEKLLDYKCETGYFLLCVNKDYNRYEGGHEEELRKSRKEWKKENKGW